MYKVFLNDLPIILSTTPNYGEKYTNFHIKKISLKWLIRQIKLGAVLYVNLYHTNEKKLIKQLRRKLKVITAAGGLVYNQKGEALFIYRNGKWDLPKGGKKRFEKVQDAAIREVEEETKVKNLEIDKFLQVTYHIMKRKGKYRLKETYWYKMKTSYTGELTPQMEEGITKVKWKNPTKTEKALEKSYANIKELFKDQTILESDI